MPNTIKKKSLLIKILLTLSIITHANLIFFPQTAAGMETIADTELDEIYGQSGVSIALKNLQIFQYIDNFTYTCPENAFGTCEGILSLKNMEYHSRSTDTMLFNYGFGTPPNGIIHYDIIDCLIASEEDWNFGTAPVPTKKLMTSVIAPVWEQEVGVFINNIEFGDVNEGGIKDIGWADLGVFDLRSFQYYTAPHGSGIDFESDFELHIDTLTYGYQENAGACKTLEFNNIHFGETFGFGLGTDDPADPATWYTATGTSIGEFKIGDILGDNTAYTFHSNPATIDAADRIQTDTTPAVSKHAAVILNLPLQGSIRFEQAEFDGTDFGPGAIDGIHAHRFKIEMVP